MSPSPSRVRALLVLALLAGLLGMHGLNTAPPVSAPAEHPAHAEHPADAEGTGSHEDVTRHAAAPGPGDRAADPRRTSAAPVEACHHRAGGPARHVQHADGTCAAAGTASAPPLPLPPPGRADAAATAGPAPAPPDGAVTARAPPSLSALQLLRI